MMLERKKSNFFVCAVLYFLVFAGFSVSYLFTYPQYDVPIFVRDFGGGFFDVVREALFYGNGRLLGNILGFYFAHHFVASSFVTAFFLTAMVCLCNLIFFNNKNAAIFPLAVLVAFPAVGILRDVYSMIAAFCNYAVPFVFALLSGLMLKKLNDGGSKMCFAVLAISSCAACLFSENTTVVLLCLAVLICIADCATQKRVSAQSIVNLVFVTVGSAIMYFIPKLTHTSEKLGDYRGFVTEPMELVKNAVYALRSFSLIANQYFMIYVLISSVILFLLYRSAKVGRFFKMFLSLILVLFPVICLLPNCFASVAYRYAVLYIAAEVVYLGAVLTVVLMLKDKRILVYTVMAVVLLGSAVAPMMIVNHRGDRTFFTTFAILFCYALVLLKKIPIAKKMRVAIETVAPITFMSICAVMLVLTAQNFNTYSFRANYIAEQRTVMTEIKVPYLAHGRLAMESQLGQIDPCIYGADISTTFKVIDVDDWEYAEEYKKIISAAPTDAVSMAIKNFEFKNPRYPEKLYKIYLKK